jgi:hypothetical protein
MTSGRQLNHVAGARRRASRALAGACLLHVPLFVMYNEFAMVRDFPDSAPRYATGIIAVAVLTMWLAWHAFHHPQAVRWIAPLLAAFPIWNLWLVCSTALHRFIP